MPKLKEQGGNIAFLELMGEIIARKITLERGGSEKKCPTFPLHPLQSLSGISYQPNPTRSEMAREPQGVRMQKSTSQQGKEQSLGLAWRQQWAN